MTLRRGLKILLAAGAGLGLAGCETLGAGRVKPAAPPPVIAVSPPPVVQVEPPPAQARPRPERSCVPRSLGPPPRYPDTDAALRNAAGAADRYQLLAAGRLLRQKRLAELERAIAACR
ncbi:hypothetical protein [Phenylobacterium zucineum]|uniref:hypothetical protein n=1 Tax=Phenylobacterium zucineum TaxID=284016 RepID=UPI0011D0BD43|nr:hypothetical protein [Phenylobacterium zucineum]